MMRWSEVAFERLLDRGAMWALVFVLILPMTASVACAAVEGSGPAAPVSEQTGETPRAVVVKGNANLRAAPSMDGNILAIAKEGTVVQVLEETSRWYRVKTDDGMDAWIYKTLVLILQIPAGFRSARATQPVAPVPAPSPAASAEGQPPPAPEQPAPSATPPLERDRPPNSPAPQAAPVSKVVLPVHIHQDPPQPVQPSGPAAVSPYALFQGVNGYLTGGLLLVLLVTIALNLRTSRQLKRAMREGLPAPTTRLVRVRAARRIRQGVHEGARVTRDATPERQVTAGVPTFPQPPAAEQRSDTGGAPSVEDASRAAITLAQAGGIPIADPATELSPLERAVVEVISVHGEVRERELMQRLEQQGFTGVLVKGVIGEIVRKTGSDGPPWVHVRYAQGGYTYRLQPRDIPTFARGSERG